MYNNDDVATSESTMMIETVWDEPPTYIVFKEHYGWPTYVQERTCNDMWFEVSRREGGDCDFACSLCGYVGNECDPNFCPNCGARVI